jgi:hypothetical protein
MEQTEVASEVENPVVRHASREIDYDHGHARHDDEHSGGHDHGAHHQSEPDYGSGRELDEGIPSISLGPSSAEHAAQRLRTNAPPSQTQSTLATAAGTAMGVEGGAGFFSRPRYWWGVCLVIGVLNMCLTDLAMSLAFAYRYSLMWASPSAIAPSQHPTKPPPHQPTILHVARPGTCWRSYRGHST